MRYKWLDEWRHRALQTTSRDVCTWKLEIVDFADYSFFMPISMSLAVTRATPRGTKYRKLRELAGNQQMSSETGTF